jgi:hypothetical protein
MKTIGKYKVQESCFGVNVYHDGTCIGGISGVCADSIDESMIEELLFGDLEEDECLIEEF